MANDLADTKREREELRAELAEAKSKLESTPKTQPPAESPLTYGGTLPDGSTLTEWEQDQIKAISDVAKNNGWLSVTIFEDGRFMVEPKKDGE
jgi:hypothetical protein